MYTFPKNGLEVALSAQICSFVGKQGSVFRLTMTGPTKPLLSPLAAVTIICIRHRNSFEAFERLLRSQRVKFEVKFE
jgi:hypothetical protein